MAISKAEPAGGEDSVPSVGLSGDCWDSLSPELYVLFWSLSLYDVHNPAKCYDDELKRIEGSHRTLDRKRNEPGMSAGDERKRKKEMDKCIATMDKLKAERADQITHCRHVRSTLSKAKDK